MTAPDPAERPEPIAASEHGGALSCGDAGIARLGAAQLAAIAPRGDFTAEAWVRPTISTTLGDVVVHDSAHARYALQLDPLGSLQFRAGLPRSFMMVPYFEGFPAARWTIELALCPFRANRASTLLSYTLPGDSRPALAIFEERDRGLVVRIGDDELATRRYMDYCQWQHLALTWDAETGALAMFHDDRDRTVAAVLDPAISASLGEPVFHGHVARGHRVRDGGFLVLGMDQRRAGDIAAFAPETAFFGFMSRIRIWDHVRARRDLEADQGRWLRGDEPGLVACYRFSALAAARGESVNACANDRNIGQLGNAGAEPVIHDRHHFRAVLTVRDAAIATGPVLTAGRWARIAGGVRDGKLELDIDGRREPAAPLPSRLLARDVGRVFRIGPVPAGLIAGVRLRTGAHVLACYDQGVTSAGELLDSSGNGHHLALCEGMRYMPSHAP